MKYILLTFDLEEFDIPLEYGQSVDRSEQLRVSSDGLGRLIPVLEKFNVKSTFFTTASYALAFKSQMKKLAESHEIASHAYTHTGFNEMDYVKSKESLEEIIHQKIYGFRMPRLAVVDVKKILDAGYSYDSSIHPAWIPGRYNHRHLPESVYKELGLIRMPCSVSPSPFRFPLFWLSFKNLPLGFYEFWLNQTLDKHGVACLYFHPWEYADITNYSLPSLVKKVNGMKLIDKLSIFIESYKRKGVAFISIKDYLDIQKA